MLDVAIIGSGPAALSAATYLGRAGIKAQLFEGAVVGGELANIAHIANYPGFDGTGAELAERMRAQAERVGAQIVYGECQSLVQSADGFTLQIDGEAIQARRVLVATGSRPKTLSFTPSAPVSYCALCEADLAHGKNVAVLGGANSAFQEAIYLAGVVNQLTLITHSAVKADRILRDELESCANVRIVENVEPTPELLSGFDHIFVFIGKLPATDFLKNVKNEFGASVLNQKGYIVTENRGPGRQHQTTIPGLFAAGDVRQGMIAQVVTAAADGASAALELVESLRK